MNIALVTGASSGLGRCYALQLAERNEVDEVWLLARRKEKLEEVSAELDGADGRVIPTDLTDREDLDSLFEELEEVDPTVTWLVNNAGFGKFGPFDARAPETNLKMIDLNIRALTEVTQRTLDYCGSGTRIVQVSSLGGFTPMANFAVYGATKDYVQHFSAALSQELESRGISVTVVSPGPVDTAFDETAFAEYETDTFGFAMAAPDEVVEESIRDAERGKLHSIYGLGPKLVTFLTAITPSFLSRMITKNLSGLLEDKTRERQLEN